MEIKEYFDMLTKEFGRANDIATKARERGYDPELFVEIKSAPDLATRVEGIMGIEGLADTIKKQGEGKTRQQLAFEIAKDICVNPRFEMEKQKRITLAVRTGLSIITDGVLVAPTEGLQGCEIHKNPDGTDYISILYAGPIRGAGGTSAALSVLLADIARRQLGVGAYKATASEVERWLEEMMIYHTRCARLQYLPPEADIRWILENCPVCVDGVPTEEIEVGIHRNMKRLDSTGKDQPLTNKVRGGIGLVMCEGIAQKAKNVLKFSKVAGVDWSWLEKVIKVEKAAAMQTASSEKKDAVFLSELVAGRPIFAYPNYPGSFRLRYGRSRLTGIAAKGFNPASMIILEEFIATGTQVKVEKPGKGCIATPVDSIEGPFVKLKSGEALRINTANEANGVTGTIAKILSVGDILVTYGDFKKTNTPMQPTSYVEEYWYEQLKAKGFTGGIFNPSFSEAYQLSKAYDIPMHPRWLYEYSDISSTDLKELSTAVIKSTVNKTADSIFAVKELKVPIITPSIRNSLERLCIPHFDDGESITLGEDNAQSLLCSLGFSKNEELRIDEKVPEGYDTTKDSLEMLNAIAPFKLMKRSTRIGARMGRPEKARERLMTPAPHVLFPVGDYGSKDRNIYKAYMEHKRRLGYGDTNQMKVEIAKYRCRLGKEYVLSAYCKKHKSGAQLERICGKCGRITSKDICSVCNSKTQGFGDFPVNLSDAIDSATMDLGVTMPKSVKGVKGLVSKDKIAEPLEKGVLRSMHGVYIFKDGTSRFDATDTPITHFYPKEIGTPVSRLRELGYTKDYLGRELTEDDQLVELRHQDVILNTRGVEYFLKVAGFIDELLVKFYKMEPYYELKANEDLIGHFVITLSPHTSCGVLGRIIGTTNASVGFAHPYTISARRRNSDGDEDTTMLLLDGLINFSRKYLPVTIGGTMDAPLILTIKILPEEVDDEVHDMEVVKGYGLEFYDKTFTRCPAGEMKVEKVSSRLKKETIYNNLDFTHTVGPTAVADAPVRSTYTRLKSMQEKIDLQFKLMDKLYTIDKADTARRLILSHFIPDLMGNLHSFSKQTFRCVSCNAKYRRVPLVGKCTKCHGKIVLTISKGGIEKYMKIATELANRYSLEPYIRQRLMLIREEIETVFGGVGGGERPVGQFSLLNYA